MSFWDLNHSPSHIAVVEAATGRKRAYGELRAEVEDLATSFPRENGKLLVLLLAQNRYECLVAYLAALNAGHALMLSDAGVNPALLTGLIERYQPDVIFSSVPGQEITGYTHAMHSGLSVFRRAEKTPVDLHPDLALLLNTSGSTGSPKLVRLSGANLQANAASIVEYLQLSPQERPITSLPMSYSYGLSVINSHLEAGATIVLTDYGVLRREFWDAVDAHSCTSLAGVPYTYQMLLQTGLLQKRGASLRTLTQAGGALAPNHIQQMHELSVIRGFRFFVMYGQTEATARIAYVPCDRLADKIGSIGIAVPGGSLKADIESGELVYTGPNVMMGYAESRTDLAKGDDQNGILRTGDLARSDTDGFFYITGRLKRFLKLFGKRFNLDEIEELAQSRCGFPVACFGRDDLLAAAIEGDAERAAVVAAFLCDTFGLPKPAVEVRAMSKIPRTGRGKVDYPSLEDGTHLHFETAANAAGRNARS